MGLRINTHLPSLTALKHLRQIDADQGRIFERISTGRQINRASDNPTQMSIADQIRSEIRSLQQLVENAEEATNLLSTADSGMAEITDLLIQVRRSMIFAGQGGSPDKILAEQDFVDNAMAAVRRIARTTRFGDINLLNGDSAFNIVSFDATGILDLRPSRVQFNPTASTTTFQITVSATGTQGRAIAAATSTAGAIAASGGTVSLLIGGPLGAVEISLASGATNTDLSAAVNSIRQQTGVYASGGFLLTNDAGERRLIRIEQTGGTGNFTGGDPLAPGFITGQGDVVLLRGTDATGLFYGKPFIADGNTVHITDPFFEGDILLNPAANSNVPPGPGVPGLFEFTIRDSGLRLQTNNTTDQLVESRVGLPTLDPTELGTPETLIGGQIFGGLLSTVETGGANDLLTNPFAGLEITRDALTFIETTRSFVGSLLANEVSSARRINEVATENLLASESVLRDADYAEQSALLVRSQVLFQSTLSVLGQANSLPQTVLNILAPE